MLVRILVININGRLLIMKYFRMKRKGKGRVIKSWYKMVILNQDFKTKYFSLAYFQRTPTFSVF